LLQEVKVVGMLEIFLLWFYFLNVLIFARDLKLFSLEEEVFMMDVVSLLA
jgi:hypothetical protein